MDRNSGGRKNRVFEGSEPGKGWVALDLYRGWRVKFDVLAKCIQHGVVILKNILKAIFKMINREELFI